MPRLSAVQADITTLAVDAIVNAANRAMRGGGGVDGAIHRAGGPAVLADCVARFPRGLATGDAGWTTAGDLPARWVIHTVGPNHRAGEQDRGLLVSCYRRSLEVADELGVRTLAFPLISAGVYGWPRQDAIAAAVDTVASSDSSVEEVQLVAFDAKAYEEIDAALARDVPFQLLHAVRLLHARGHHGLRIFPSMAPSGLYWRLSISVGDSGLSYTTGAGTEVAGGRVTVTSSPDELAELILAALPGAAGTADDPAYVAWYDDLMRRVDEHGKLPIASADYFDPAPGWEIGWGSGVRIAPPPDPTPPGG